MNMMRARHSFILLLALLFLCGLLFSGIAFWYTSPPHSPSGDEPHYLIISQTLLKYHSLDVMQDYIHRDYYAFYPLPITPHVVPAAHGRLLPVHGIGGPVLWLLAYALLGWLGVLLFMSAVTLLIVWNIYRFLVILAIKERYALLVSGAYAVASPLTIYAHLAFIEPLAALFCLYVVRKVIQKEIALLEVLLCSVCLGLLPWIHIRFALLEVVLFFAYLYKLYRLRQMGNLKLLLAYLLPVTLLFLALEGYTFFFWGTFNPAASQLTMENKPFTGSLLQGITGMLFDQEYGLIVNFPIFFFLLAGCVLAWKRRYLTLHILLLALSLPYVVETASLADWTGGWCPPVRFLLVLLPLYSFYLAYVLQCIQQWSVTLLFCGAVLYGVCYNMLALHHSFNRKSGQNLTLANIMVFHHSLTDYLPSFFRPHGQSVLTTWVMMYLALSLLLFISGYWGRRQRASGRSNIVKISST